MAVRMFRDFQTSLLQKIKSQQNKRNAGSNHKAND